jgi:hypothetical protein
LRVVSQMDILCQVDGKIWMIDGTDKHVEEEGV